MPLELRRTEPISKLEFFANQVVEGFITGLHKSPMHGFSVEFAEHRLYNTGESTRHIDWKLYGRTEKLFIKRYEEETNLRAYMLVDWSRSMYFPEKVINPKPYDNKISFAIHSVAALTSLLRRQRDAVSLGLFSEKLDLLTPCKSSVIHQNFLFKEMEKVLKNEEVRSTSTVHALNEIAEKAGRRALIFIFSDMFDAEGAESGKLYSALQHLRHNNHEVILFHVTDKKLESELDFQNRPYTFVDIETGEKLKLNPTQVKEKYKELYNNRMNQLKIKCGHFGIDFVSCDVNQNFDQILLSYLIKRKKIKH